MFTACGIMHRRCCLLAESIVGALYHKLKTQSSAPEDGRNYRPKHVELIEIINNKIIILASSWLFILLYHFRSSVINRTTIPRESIPWAVVKRNSQEDS